MEDNSQNLSKKPWYKTWWGIIIQILFWPITIVVWIMIFVWKSGLPKWAKIIITGLIVLFLFVGSYTTETNTTSPTNSDEPLSISVNGIQDDATLKEENVEFEIQTTPAFIDRLTVNGQEINQGLLDSAYKYENTLTEGENRLLIKATHEGESEEMSLNVNVDLTEKREAEAQAQEQEEQRIENMWTNALADVSYDDLFRSNEDYIGETVRLEGEIIQAVSEDDNFTFRINITETGEYYTFYEDTIMATYETNERYLEEDIVEFIGNVEGLHTYESVIGAEVELPLIKIEDMRVVQKAGDREL